ncbi:DNA-3-methyladenine glycosylase I [bacterium]|nr:DNA-3-methyladenine glycosylase I [bacterium]
MFDCNWKNTSALNSLYHDTEWGIPLHDDRGQFEFLMLEVMQCGLNWNMIINKREVFRQCFDNFDYNKIASYAEEDIERIINTAGMIRSRRKIEAIISNARCFIRIREEFGSFSEYLWAYSEGKTILYEGHSEGFVPASNGLSDKISKDLKKRGFKYLGTITIYSHLQACGIINDHGKDCPCYQKIVSNYPTVRKQCYLEKNIALVYKEV